MSSELQQQIHEIRQAQSSGFMQGSPAVRPLLVNSGAEVEQKLRHVIVVISDSCGNKKIWTYNHKLCLSFVTPIEEQEAFLTNNERRVLLFIQAVWTAAVVQQETGVVQKTFLHS